MASKILGIAKCLRSLTQKTAIATSLRRSMCTAGNRSLNQKVRATKKLYSILSPLGDPTINVVPVLDQWIKEGHEISLYEFRHVVITLRARKRVAHALQVSEWMSSKDISVLSSSDIAVHLDLIGRVRGLEAAESYFDSLGDIKENDKVYCALLYCYVRKRLVDKSLSLFQRMKDLGFVSTLAFNNMMILYEDTDQVEKIPDVFLEMKNFNCPPDYASYKICIQAYGNKSDFDNIERVIKEMESQSKVPAKWSTYSMVTNFYIKAGNREKALIYLTKCEELVGKDAIGCNFLITHHADLGHIEDVMRLWGLQKANPKKQILNRDYIVILDMLAKHGELEEAEQIFKEWESSCKFYDFVVPNILLKGYCQKGLTNKAESTLNEIIAKGKTPTPDSWRIITTGYSSEENMKKAYDCFKNNLALQTGHVKWKSRPTLVMKILNWLVENRGVEEVEAFISSVKNTVPEKETVSLNKKMYSALIRAYKRSGKEVDEVLERMKIEGIDVDEEIENVLAQAV